MTVKKTSTFGDFMREKGWAYLLLVAAGLGLGAYQIASYQSASRFAVDGVDVVGLVTNKSDYPRSGNKHSYRLNYTFPTPADPYNQGIQDVSKTFYDTHAEDDSIVVRYLPADPSISTVEPANITKGFWLGMIVSIGLVLGGIAGGAYAMLRAHRARPE